MKRGAMIGILSAALALVGIGASCSSPAKTAVDAGALAICILNHSDEPVDQIVKDCNGATAQLVADILAAHRAAEEREASRAKLKDGGRD